MPRENRKRGRKHKKAKDEGQQEYEQQIDYTETETQTQGAGPSWIVDKKNLDTDKQLSSDAPFGFVDPDLKAYFRTVDEKLREWQETATSHEVENDNEVDPNEERRMFMVAALSEASGKEKQLATDPDCSNVLERMAYSMDDFVKRVFIDRLAGSYEQLSMHRFGSHVLQTLLSISKGTILREKNGIQPTPLDTENEEQDGKLPLLTQLIVNLCNELIPSSTTLLMDRFASHVLRALFILLCPDIPSAAETSTILRSKKSVKHREKQGPMKSVLTDVSNETDEKGKNKSGSEYPSEFKKASLEFVRTIKNQLNGNEIRALAVNEAACPLLVILLEMEASHDLSNEPGSLMDSLLSGLITSTLQDTTDKLEASDYVTTLLRDPAASHVLEKIISLAPQTASHVMWDLYFKGKLSRLAAHPVANYVVARVFDRISEQQLFEALDELSGAWSKIIKNSQTGVLKSLIDRTIQLQAGEEDISKVVFDAFGLDSVEAQEVLVDCILSLKPYKDYKLAANHEQDDSKKGEINNKNKSQLEPTVQGSIIIQSLLHLHEPHNHKLIENIVSLPPARLLKLSHHPTSSRIIDALLSSPNVPSRYRRKLILAYLGHFPELVDDRVGSRVGERLWNAADPYLKEKVARTLIPHENSLYGSRYGKFFIRGLNLYLLKKDPEKWKTQQSSAKTVTSATGLRAAEPAQTVENGGNGKNKEIKGPKRKREEKPEDEIDKLFVSALGKRQKKGSLVVADSNNATTNVPHKESKQPGDKDLDSVLGAIRGAPKETKVKKKQK